MSLNLHSIVRGPINAVNPDYVGLWLQSNGYAQSAPGAQPVPQYIHHPGVTMQVQAGESAGLKHADFLSIQGVKRVVYMYSDAQGVNRPNAEGGDLLIFPEHRGGPNRVWLVVKVLETWTPDAAGWCRVGVVLQVDAEVPSS